MAGIGFWKTSNLDAIEEFYSHLSGMKLWLRQAGCALWPDEHKDLPTRETDEFVTWHCNG